jgi:N6-adenosine-specific RNA methylase IME4
MRYDLILCDCPWHYAVWSKKGAGRTAEHHYPTMKLAELFGLHSAITRLCQPNTALLMWATWPNLPDAMSLIEAWGFRYTTAAFVWVKRTRLNKGWHTGMGYYSRANTEPLLLATRGKPLKRHSKAVSQLIIAPLRQHSQKPDEQYEKIDQLFGTEINRLELFARQTWPGWATWGHGVTGSQTLDEFSRDIASIDVEIDQSH